MISSNIKAFGICMLFLAIAVQCKNSASEQTNDPFSREYTLGEGGSLSSLLENAFYEAYRDSSYNVLGTFEWDVNSTTKAAFLSYEDEYNSKLSSILLVPTAEAGRYRLTTPEAYENSVFGRWFGSVSYEVLNMNTTDMDGDGNTELQLSVLTSGMVPAEEGDGAMPFEATFGEVVTYRGNAFALDAGLSKAYKTALEKQAEEEERKAREMEEKELAGLLSSYPATIESREQMKEILTRMGLASHDDGEETRLRSIGKDEVKGFYYNKCEDYGWNSIVTADSDAESDEGSEVYPVFTFSYQDTYNFKIVNMLNDGKNLSFGLEELDYNLQPVAEGSGLTRNSSEFIIYRLGKSWIVEEQSGGYANYYTATTYLENIREIEVECEEEEY